MRPHHREMSPEARSILPLAPPPLPGWCHYPAEELQRVFEGGATPVPGRYLCGACGELLFASLPLPGSPPKS